MRKTTWWLLFFKLITLNGWLTRKRIKTNIDTVNEQLLVSQTTDMNVNHLCTGLGSISNIEKVSANISSLKILVKDHTLVNKDLLTSVGVKGMMVNKNQLVLVVGDDALTISAMINKMISDKSN